jgi:hypothetical protein
MSDRAYAKVQAQQKTLSGSSSRSSLLQRTCACGQHTIAGAECSTCRSEQSTLQRFHRAFESPSAPGAVSGSSPAQEHGPSFNAAFDRASRFGHDFSRIPIHPPAAGVIQTKLAINKPGDQYEQEADRLADQVMSRRRPFASSHQDVLSHTEDVIHASASHRSSGEKALEHEDRQFFESRFNHNFADVRVYADREANKSALGLQARAYTVGNNISFAPGEYRPGTTEGRHLLAHELSHVIQQRSMSRPDSLIIQRQPQQTATKQTPPAKQKTLSDAGVSLGDPVFDNPKANTSTAQIIDEVLQRNQRLAPYIGDKLKSGLRIAEKGKFIQELSNGNFDDSYRNAYDLNSSETVPSDILGFYDYKNSVVHLRPDAKFGTALHEAVHRLASPTLYSQYLPIAMQVSGNLAEVLKEGLTAYFTDCVLSDEGLPNLIDAYSDLKKKARKLVSALGPDGFDLIAKFNFRGADIVEIGNKLNLSRKQYGDLKGGGPKEVLKRMNNLL